MKKLILSVFLVLALASPSLAALSAATVWEYRASATASNVNGGGFVTGASGTDYSQQDAAQLALTDLASAGDWLTVTSVTGGFTDAMIGNLIHITAATGSVTVGWYQILTRADTNTITVDRATGTGNWTAGTGRIGGALSLPTSATVAAMVAGNTAWVKYGTYDVSGASVAIGTAGTNIAQINFSGYKTTRGDNPTLTDRPTLSLVTRYFQPANYWTVSNIIFTGTGTVVVSGFSYSTFKNCKFSGSNAAGIAFSSIGYQVKIIGCEFSQTGGTALSLDWGPYLLHGNYIHNSATCFNNNDSNSTIAEFNIFSTCSTAAASFNYANLGNKFISNTFYGGETPTGIGINGGLAHNLTILNNIFYGFVTAISMTTAYTDCYVNYNNFYNNTSDVSNFTKGLNDIALNPQFVSPSTGDFRIGANLRAKGFPGDFGKLGANPNTIGLMDIGAIQGWTQEPFAPTLRYYYGTGYPRFCN